MKIEFRLHLTYMKLEEDSEGNQDAEKRETHLANKQVHTITKANIKSAVEEHINEIISKIEV